jgi:hypothetical protein
VVLRSRSVPGCPLSRHQAHEARAAGPTTVSSGQGSLMEEMIQAQATAMRTACARMTTLDPPRRDRHALMDFLASKLIRRKSQHVAIGGGFQTAPRAGGGLKLSSRPTAASGAGATWTPSQCASSRAVPSGL